MNGVIGQVRKWVGVFCLAVLAGCATLPAPKPLGTAVAPAGYLNQFHLAGRISVRRGNEGSSGNLQWQHLGQSDEVTLLTPLGQAVAQITRRPGQARLFTANGRSYVAHNVTGLTEEALGYPLPLEGLQYWVQGKAAPGEPAQVQKDAKGLVASIQQEGWQIHYPRYQPVAGQALPALIDLSNGEVTVRVVIDQWTLT